MTGWKFWVLVTILAAFNACAGWALVVTPSGLLRGMEMLFWLPAFYAVAAAARRILA